MASNLRPEHNGPGTDPEDLRSMKIPFPYQTPDASGFSVNTSDGPGSKHRDKIKISIRIPEDRK